MDERLTFGYGTSHSAARAFSRGGSAEVASFAPAPPPTARVREHGDVAFNALLAFTALLYFRPQDTIRPLAIIPLAEFAAITGLVAMAFGRLRHGLALSRVTPELLGVIALGGVILFTAPFSIWIGGAVATFTGLYVKVVLIFALMVNTLTSPERVRRFTWVLVLATTYIAFRAVFDYLRGFNLVENGRVMGAVGGMFENPNDLALNMVAILPLSVLLALRSDSVTGRLFAIAAAFLMIGATIASQSRSGFLGLAAMMVFLSILVGRKSPRVVAAGALAVLLALPLVPPSYWQRMSSITDDSRDETGSRQARRVLLGEAWKAFLENPLTGVGAGNFVAYDPQGRTESWKEAHNVLLQVASELGILGIGVFLFLIYRAMFAGRQTSRLLLRAIGVVRKRRWGATAPESPPQVVTVSEAAYLDAHSAAITAAVAGWFFSALFASVAYNWTFYYLLALAVAPREILLDRLAGRSVPHSPVVRRPATHKAGVPAEVQV
jgi:putative inorganic carbon (hco3(-)) transporter